MIKKLILILMTGTLGLSGAVHAAAKNPLAASGRDNKSPIEINADALEVFQEENKAIFTGHVVVIQGTVRLKSEKMTVHYRQQEEKKGQDMGAGAIRRIDVEGNVFLSTPEETASGTSGVYDVEHQQIVLNNNVVLTRGKNTLKGDRLVYDLASGKSNITGGAIAQPGTKGKERVRALFLPDNQEQKK
jgi:lipopolysaccharide export system protein LptA